MRHRFAAAALVAGAAFLAAGAVAPPAGAHAVLESTTPADRARLDEAPSSITFTFSETVGATTGAVRVYDASGTRVDTGRVDTDGGVVTVGLEDGLGDDAFVATYRVVSADGHPVSGAISFTVGDGPELDDEMLSSLFDDDADRPWEIAGAALRWLAYGGALFATGAAAFVLVVDPTRRRPTVTAVRVAAAAAAVGIAGNLLVQAHLASGLGLWSLFRDGVAGDVLADGVGLSAAVVVAGLVAIAATVGVSRHGGARPALAAGALAASAGFALSGHTATSDPEWLVTAADAVHAVTAGVWFGGLVLLVGAIRRHRRGDDPTAAAGAVGRFSVLAGASLVAAAAAGAALSWSEVRTLDGLTGTGYGQLLLVKVGVVAVVAGLAAYNRLRLVPAVRTSTADRPRSTAWRRLRLVATSEAALLVVVLALSSVLVQVTPARALATAPFSTTVELGDGSVNVVVDPPRVGDTELHLYLLDESGRPGDLFADGVTVELSLPSEDIGPLVREPYVAGPGHYQLDGDVFAIAGTWDVTVSARASRFESLSTTVEVPIRR